MVLSWMAAATVAAAVAATIHVGGLVVWALLINFRGLLAHVPVEALVRVYRGWGPVQGLSLGVWIAAMLVKYPMQAHPGKGFPDCYRLVWGGLIDQLTFVRAVCFGVLWVSYLLLEVWSLEPCRQLDRDGRVSDPARYAAAVGRVSRHLALNALLGLAVVALGAFGARG